VKHITLVILEVEKCLLECRAWSPLE
jgi:hypothetical protein